MRRYFESFDYLKTKYSPLLKTNVAYSNGALNCFEKYDPLIYKEFLNYERAKHHSLYNNINYADIKKSIKLIYNSDEEANNFIFFYDFALDQLLDRYLNISQLDNLFSHHYFEFEWQQHMDLDFQKNDLSFYRDHFIHQIRNCYMLLEILHIKFDKSEKLIDKLIDLFKTRNNELFKYANVQVEQYEEHIKNVVDKTLSGLVNNSQIKEKDIDRIKVLMKINAEDFAWEYFIKGSLIIAALFHDIGYPIKFMHNRSMQLNDYLSAVLPTDSIGFDKLNDLLEKSLLFTVCQKDELKTRYNEFDHGALSAYVFLLQFYEAGAIYSLNPIKKAMIEFAALAMYDHTLRYKISEDKNPHRGKPSFSENPISYLLRVVDDAQEWDRLYFEIRSNSDLRYCEKCKMPISRIWNSEIEKCFNELETKEDFERFGNSIYLPETSMKRIYACGCTKVYQGSFEEGYYNNHVKIEKALKSKIKGGYHFSPGIFENGSLFSYQKINYTVTAKQIYFVDNKIYIDYDAFMQLYLLTINPEALKYRIGELSKINDQFKLQKDLDFKICAFLSDNPLILKLRIICIFLYESGYYIYNLDKKIYQHNPLYENMVKDYIPDFKFFYSLAEHIKNVGFFIYDYSDEINTKRFSVSLNKLKDKLENYLEAAIKFLIQIDLNKRNEKFVNNLIFLCKKYLSFLFDKRLTLNSKYIDMTHKNACKTIFNDALSYIKNLHLIDIYYKERKENSNNDKIEYSLKILLDKKYYNPIILRTEELNKDNFEFFDFYSDLYLFKEMHRFSIDNYERRQNLKINNKNKN